jgi:uncharacterized protein YodC (DUF2158 family)
MTPQYLRDWSAARAADTLKQRIGSVFVIEDPAKFGPGVVVVEDGKKRRMMITKIVAGFAECVWFEHFVGRDGLLKTNSQPRTEIVNVNMLTLDRDQKWRP